MPSCTGIESCCPNWLASACQMEWHCLGGCWYYWDHAYGGSTAGTANLLRVLGQAVVPWEPRQGVRTFWLQPSLLEAIVVHLNVGVQSTVCIM
jgi:hypothetical protein